MSNRAQPTEAQGDGHQFTDGEINGAIAAALAIQRNAFDDELAALKASKQAEIEALRAWKESALQVMNAINLQEAGKIMGLQLGSDISVHIVPELRRLKAAEVAHLAALAKVIRQCAAEIDKVIADGCFAYPENVKHLLRSIRDTQLALLTPAMLEAEAQASASASPSTK